MDTTTCAIPSHRPRTCGLRLSALDVVVIVLAILVGIGAYWVSNGFSLFVPFVVGHFFLFCNVFRIRRRPELIWAGIFVINCAAWLLAGIPNLPLMCAAQLPVTVAILLKELRVPTYHGIFARRVNPRIDDYLVGKI